MFKRIQATMLRLRQMGMAVGLLAFVGLSGCSKDSDIKPLSELKSDQEDAIDDFISARSIRTSGSSLESLPETIDSNVFYHMSNGVYLRVLDRGDMSRRPIAGQTRVFVKFKGFIWGVDTPQYRSFNNLNDPSLPPVEFRYTSYYNMGWIHYELIPERSSLYNLDNFMCEGLSYPMALLGDGARVQMIIPFEVGPSETYTKGYPTFIEEAEYEFATK